MQNIFTTNGKTDDKGALYIYERPDMNTFLQNHKGKIIHIEMRAVDENVNPLIAYFYGVVIPRAQTGYNELGNRFDRKQVEEELKGISPVTCVMIHTGGRWVKNKRSISQLSGSEMREFLEDVYRFCREELSTIIPNPNDYEEKIEA